MYVAEQQTKSISHLLVQRLGLYLQLTKVRLTSLVVFSAMMGYLLAGGAMATFHELLLLAVGGFGITGAANTLNQIIERDYDKLMQRTADRPLPSQRLTVKEAGIFAITLLGGGIATLFYLHPFCALLGLTAVVLYAFVYTPMKRHSSLAVFAGAIPGALPAAIGWIAATHSIGIGAWLLFSIQFVWQFPHTWSIAWLLDDDYQKAGFQMLPSQEGRDRWTATQIFIYTLLLIPISLLPAKFGITGVYSSIVILLAGILFLWQALLLLKNETKKAAVHVMLGSFLYLPIVQIALVADKLL